MKPNDGGAAFPRPPQGRLAESDEAIARVVGLAATTAAGAAGCR